ncbi:MAG: SIS domain-containing protein, partial [Bacilli bacterium]
MEINMDVFYDHALSYIDELQTKELSNIKKAALICSESIKNDGVIHVFGSGHSVGFGIEMTNQVGSLIPIHLINTSDFVTKGLFSLKEFKDQDVIFERRPNIVGQLYDLYPINPNDAFILVSDQGNEGLLIEFSKIVKARNHKLI